MHQRTRARRQPQDANETLRVLLLVAGAHGEAGDVGPVQRRRRFAARDIDVALVECQRHRAVDIVLRAFDESLQRFAQRREPQAEVHDLGVLQADVLLEVRQVAVEAQRFQLAMRGEQQRSAGRLIAAARLDADEAVLHQVDAANGVARADFVQHFDNRHRIEHDAVHRDRHAVL